jgi:hypothetical protein
MSLNFTTQASSYRTSGTFPEVDIGSICYWVNLDVVGGNRRIVGTDTSWESRLDSSSNMLHEYRQGGTVKSTTVFNTGTWYHVVFSWDGSTKQVYVNGVKEVDTTDSNASTGNDTLLSLGTSTHSPTQGLDGTLEDVRIYNRVLTDKEIGVIYNGSGRDGIFNGLQNWWKMTSGAFGVDVTQIIDLVSKLSVNSYDAVPKGHYDFNLKRRRV